MILIVDDKPENIFSLKSILELNKFEVDVALSGEEALKKILKNTYALIILDVQMPGMDGFEVAEAISGFNKAKDTPIIFLSAVNTHKKFITKGYESGAIDYITKPVDVDILLLKVKTFNRIYEQKNELNEMQKALRAEIDVRKETENKLQGTVRELNSILESLPQIAFTATKEGAIEKVNQYWYNYSPDKKTFPQNHPDDICIQDEWKQAVQKKAPIEFEVRIKEVNSTLYHYFLLRATPIASPTGEVMKWVGTLTNIHEQKLLSDILELRVMERTHELLETNKQLETSNHDLQQFASVASHDLKEPLRKIQMFSSILRDPSLCKDRFEMYLNKIIHSSERMSRLIEDLLNFSRLSQADIFELTDINKVISDILTDLELTITEKQAQITVDEIPPMEVAPGLIRQLFQNIISNALKFTQPQVPPQIRISAELVDTPFVNSFASNSGKYCSISIADNGIGFDEKYASKIFTLFQRLNSRDEYEGTGIGLAIVKKIVDKHNGFVQAKSEPGKGATFTIVLPITQDFATREKGIESALFNH